MPDSFTPVAIVTGAGSGIGRETAVQLAHRGWRLGLVGRREEPLLETAALLVEGARSMVIAADVGVADQAGAMVDAVVARFGRLDALVNNAGFAPVTPIARNTPSLIDEVYRVNALGPAYAIVRAWPVFVRQRSGCVVNVSTIGTIDPFPGFFAYAAAKAAVNLMARSCAVEGRSVGVRAFAVAPGAVETPMLRANFPESAIPRSACLAPADVARLIVACIGGEHDRRNGETITITAT
jgi:NAD(P)-dependent dehydrogenase (short-subunit alcohol dehydrogenase family)